MICFNTETRWDSHDRIQSRSIHSWYALYALRCVCVVNYCFAVNPHKISGQNLYKQYAGKEGKIVLDVRWVHECIKTGSLLTYQNNWGGCKVTGTETYVLLSPLAVKNTEVLF